MNSKRAEYREILRATLTGDFQAAQDKAAQLGDIRWADSGLLVGAVFAITVNRRFGDDASHASVKAFVEEARQNFAESERPIKPLMAEALVRGVLGEPELLREIPREEAMPTQIALAYKILDEEEATPADVDRLLDEAEELAEKWAPTR